MFALLPRRSTMFLLIFGALAVPALFARSADASSLSLIVTDAGSVEELRALTGELERRGAVIHHYFPPDGALGEVPAGLDPERIPELAGRVYLVADPTAAPPNLAPARARAAWERLHGPWAALFASRPEGVGAAPEADTFAGFRDTQGAGVPEAAGLPCNNSFATSMYLLGDVSVGILFPESVNVDPLENTENWSAARQDEAVAEIVQACDELAAAYPEAGLDFFYDVRRDLPTDVEPIVHDSAERELWIHDTMVYLGYTGVGAYIQSIRTTHGTDWTLAAFVVDSMNDTDGVFPNGRFAFAYLGGPYMVMTYDNDGWGIGRMDTVFAHELGHNFLALDEYVSAAQPCERRSGVLQVENQNSLFGTCTGTESCLMRADTFPTAYCHYSRGQLGLWDSDGNGIPDLRDTPPQSAIDPVTPSPSASPDVTVTGTASAMPDRGEVPYYPTHTLNTISGVEYSLDGGSWSAAASEDGDWGSLCERFSVSLTGLTDGWHTIETRATADACDPMDVDICDPPKRVVEQTAASARFYINTDCVEDAFEPNDLPGEEVPIPSGTLDALQICAFDPDRFALYLRAGASLNARAEYVNTAGVFTLALYSPAGDLLVAQDGTAGTADIACTATQTGWHALVFTGQGESETPYRLVTNLTCIDDRFEPNAAAAGAPLLNNGLFPDLQLCRTDDDWYRVSLSALADLHVAVSHTASLGDLDVFLYDPSLAQIGSSETSGDIETIDQTGLASGVYAVLVRGASPVDENRYDLEITATGCMDDGRENDDTRAAATPIAGTVDGRACPGDDDWFSVALADFGMLQASLAYPPTGGDLDLELLDAAGGLLKRSATAAGPEHILAERLSPGTYFVRVAAAAGAENDYRLTVNASDPILLFAVHQNDDVVLDWSDSGSECYWLRRSIVKQTFDGQFETVIDIATATGDETGFDATSYLDADLLFDGALYYYKVLPTACGGSLVTLSKTVTPYPIYDARTYTGDPEYTLTLRNEGRDTAMGIIVEDDVPPAAFTFRVLEIPAGATDTSTAAGGRFGRGLVRVEGFSVAAGETAQIRFAISKVNSVGTNGPNVVRNLARARGWTGSGGAFETVSDDPATYAAYDSTDFLASSHMFSIMVSAFWNQDVDVDLRIVDPCGNLIGAADAFSAECPTGTAGGRSMGPGDCGATWPWGWAEAVYWSSPVAVTSGTYQVWLRYTESRVDPASTCLHGGPEDVVVYVERPMNSVTSWIVLDPAESDWVHAVDFDVP